MSNDNISNIVFEHGAKLAAGEYGDVRAAVLVTLNNAGEISLFGMGVEDVQDSVAVLAKTVLLMTRGTVQSDTL